MPTESKKIKVLELEPASDLGGVTQFIARMVQYLPKDIFEIHFAASDNGPAFELFQHYEVTTHVVDTHYGAFPPREKVQALRNLLQKNAVDIVHAHTVRAGLLAVQATRGTSIKVIYTAHGWRYQQLHNPFKRAMMFFVERYIVQHVQAVTYLTKMECQQGQRLALHTQHAVIPLSLNINEYEGMHEISNQFTVAMIGRLAYQKDPKTFIKTVSLLKNIPDIHFLWAGEGELRPQVEALINNFELNEKITLLGHITRPEIITLLHKTDALLFTSHFEGLPIVLLEAMAAEVPIVAAAVSGIPEIIINDENGLLFKEGHAQEAAEKIMTLYNDKDKRIMLAQRAKALIEKEYTPVERCAQEFTALYQNIYATNH